MLKKGFGYGNNIVGFQFEILAPVSTLDDRGDVDDDLRFDAILGADYVDTVGGRYIRESPRSRDGLHQSDPFIANVIGAGRFYLAENDETTAVGVIYEDRNLRIDEVITAQQVLEFGLCLPNGQAADMNGTQERIRNGALRRDAPLYGQVSFIENGNLDRVQRLNAIIVLNGQRLVGA